METYVFEANDSAYFAIGAGIILFDRFVLGRFLPSRLYFLLHLPTTFMHELMHWLVCLLCGGMPTMKSLIPRKDKEGLWLLGQVEWEELNSFWGVGLVSMAPAINLLLAWLAFRYSVGAESMPLQDGLICLVVILGLIEAGIPSWNDFSQGNIFSWGVMCIIFLPIMFSEAPPLIYQYVLSMF